LVSLINDKIMKFFLEEPTKEAEIIGLHRKLLEKYDDDLNKNATLGFEKIKL
jgi:hypothetical protein